MKRPHGLFCVMSSTEYQEIISTIPFSWTILKKHRHQRTAGIDHESISTFVKVEKQGLARITKLLQEKKYEFNEMRPAPITQRGKKRTILIATVEDRIVCKALLQVVSPKFDSYNSNRDYSRNVEYLHNGEQPKFKGVPLAALAIQDHMAEGYTWIVEADIKKFFDNVPKEKILE